MRVLGARLSRRSALAAALGLLGTTAVVPTVLPSAAGSARGTVIGVAADAPTAHAILSRAGSGRTVRVVGHPRRRSGSRRALLAGSEAWPALPWVQRLRSEVVQRGFSSVRAATRKGDSGDTARIVNVRRPSGGGGTQSASRTLPVAVSPSTPPVTVAANPAPAVETPNDPSWAQEWGLLQVGAPAAWNLAKPTRQVVIAVIDSGVDASQPDLQGALVPGADFADASGSTADQFGHGTMVAGVIAARGNNGTGVAGACWSCLIMPIKVLGADGSGTAAAIADGIRFAADNGANVINMSFILSGSDPGVESAIVYAHDKGVLVVAAAGNGGNADPTYPASYPGVVSVAATDSTDHLYPWSTYGSWVTLAAPGCAVTTAMGDSYGPFCGTSAAAPLVAGLAGLALASSSGSEADVEAALEQTADPLPGLVGSGRVDALQLVQKLTQ